MTKFTTDQFTFFLLSLLLIMLIEITLFNNGAVINLIIGACFIYFGLKRKRKYMFYIGGFFIFIALLTLWSLRLYIIALIAYLLYKQITKKEEIIEVTNRGWTSSTKANTFIGTTAAPLDAYKWEDVQIQRFVGDIVIDTTQTILPAGKSIISIQQTIGKIQVLVPYEVTVRLHYTTFYGEAICMHEASKRLVNESLLFEDGQTNEKRILVIFVSTWFGDVEVSRV
ncbi:cell wall-active antibiotics response protein LiaF [Solibacillus sp. CAU 1738]